MMAHEQERTLAMAGLSAYVEVQGKRDPRHIVLCRACGNSSPPLAPDGEIEWFNRHAAEDREEHRRARRRK